MSSRHDTSGTHNTSRTTSLAIQPVTPEKILSEMPELEEIIGRHLSQGMFLFGNHPFLTDARPGLDYMKTYSYPNLARALLSILNANRQCDIYLFRNFESSVIPPGNEPFVIQDVPGKGEVKRKIDLETVRADYVQAIVVPSGGQPLPLLMGSYRQMGTEAVEDATTFGNTIHRVQDRNLAWMRLEDTVYPPGKEDSPTLKDVDKNFSNSIKSTYEGNVYVLATTDVFKEDITREEAGKYEKLELFDMRPESFPSDGNGVPRTVSCFKVTVSLGGQELETFPYREGAVVLDDDGDEVDFDGLDLVLQKSKNILASRPDIASYLEDPSLSLIEDKYKEFVHEELLASVRERIKDKMEDENPDLWKEKNAPSIDAFETALNERFERALKKYPIDYWVTKKLLNRTEAERKLAALVFESITTARNSELAKIHTIADGYRNEFNTDLDALANAKSYKIFPQNVTETLRLAAKQMKEHAMNHLSFISEKEASKTEVCNLLPGYTFKCNKLKAMAFPCTPDTIFDGTGEMGFDGSLSLASLASQPRPNFGAPCASLQADKKKHAN